MKRLNGFSLMEMLLVLLIVSIIAAASAPFINRKLVGVASEKSPWIWVGNSQSIAYNPNDSNERTASIGTMEYSPNSNKPRLFIKSPNAENPQIALRSTTEAPLNIIWHNKTIAITDQLNSSNKFSPNSVIIGSASNSQSSNNSVIIGRAADAKSANESVALGDYARALMPQSVAIGTNSYVNEGNSSGLQMRAIAIGYNARATHSDSIAIGGKWGNYATTADGTGSIAIGSTAVADGDFAIAIGGKAGSNTGVEGSSNTTKASGQSSTAIGMYALAGGANSAALGNSARAASHNSTALGDRTIAGYSATSVGSEANAASSHSVAIGFQARTGNALRPNASTDSGAIAIGPRANARGQDAVAIGTNSIANFNKSVAIGYEAEAKAPNQIVLGSPTDTVYIPGNLVVAKNTLLGVNSGSFLVMRVKDKGYLPNGYDYADGTRQISADINAVKTVGGFTLSDRRIKNVGKVFVASLDEIKKLEVFNYTFKNDPNKTPRVGIMAQDLQKIFPNAVVKGDDGFLRIRMEDMFYALINAVKELDIRLTKHDKQIEQLTKENLELKTTVSKLEKRLTELEKKIK